MDPTNWLKLAVEQYLRDLPDDEFNQLMQLVRPARAEPATEDGGRAAFARSLFGGRGE